ncbi:MAG: aminomethyl-transferring glycine dehydrogenase subunit GcvPA [Desulfobacteraceae bacterium]|nr:aminomethyl-transferring glycine dehydrogenase subunit GcvPA [Desulfobacteraceae bacterium]MBC2749828.1 aminomethyl-transferring glycine dehydrogenase subunit GcvPA [Desulfobacteraceae bacterium]
MRYLPHTPKDIATMLQAVGMPDLDGLFSTIPDACKRTDTLDIPELTEWELNDHMAALAGQMVSSADYKMFAGAGSYQHYIPEVTRYLLSRSEFVTAYTPYQPEISQGTLQGIFEYQTLICRLLGMDVANASLYDGAMAVAEALLMAIRIGRRKKTVAVSSLVNPYYRKVVETYFAPTEFTITWLPYRKDGTTDLSGLDQIEGLAGVAVQSPNFFGCIEDLEAAGKAIHAQDAIFITCFSEPLAYGVLKAPGALDADIVCGEGQSLGIPQSFGGPGLGIFAAKQQYVRNLPGRLVGQTVDADGKRGFVLTLSTREQHIRREKATSNICSNQSLCAMAAGMYMAALGGTGFRELASLNHDKAEYLKAALQAAGLEVPFASATFNEFVVKFPEGFDQRWQDLLQKKILAGIPMVCYYPELANHYLLCVTETRSKDDMDALVKEVQS